METMIEKPNAADALSTADDTAKKIIRYKSPSKIYAILLLIFLNCIVISGKAQGLRPIQSRQEQQKEDIKIKCLEIQQRLNKEIEYVNSPNYRWTAFVEWTSELDPYSLGDGNAVQSQIKLITNETGAVKVVVPFRFDGVPEKSMQGFDNITWTLESDGFYFTTRAWAVADAIHYYNISSGRTHYVSHGLGIEGVFSEGEYKGYIATSQTKIEAGQGRIAYRVAISPDGKTTIRLTDENLTDKVKTNSEISTETQQETEERGLSSGSHSSQNESSHVQQFFNLEGRSIVGSVPIPAYVSNAQGCVVIEITVDANGNVVSAVSIARNSTTNDSVLVKAALDAALKARFDMDPKNPLQAGTITYNFILQ
jgi:TonB family protein